MREKDGKRHFEVIDSECVGCNLCMHVCPVEQCITMERVDAGEYANWTTHPNNPARVDADVEENVKAA
jgi:dihydropyrimidine dehydrogenase (NAD+) subunit PreA